MAPAYNAANSEITQLALASDKVAILSSYVIPNSISAEAKNRACFYNIKGMPL